jgi:hypothetical protein
MLDEAARHSLGRSMPEIKVNWEWCEFKPPCVWQTIKKRAIETTHLNLSAIQRCVYVVRIAHTYSIQYRLRASPKRYIGRGSFKQRITAHIDWINELAAELPGLEIQVWFFYPTRQTQRQCLQDRRS